MIRAWGGAEWLTRLLVCGPSYDPCPEHSPPPWSGCRLSAFGFVDPAAGLPRWAGGRLRVECSRWRPVASAAASPRSRPPMKPMCLPAARPSSRDSMSISSGRFSGWPTCSPQPTPAAPRCSATPLIRPAPLRWEIGSAGSSHCSRRGNCSRRAPARRGRSSSFASCLVCLRKEEATAAWPTRKSRCGSFSRG